MTFKIRTKLNKTWLLFYAIGLASIASTQAQQRTWNGSVDGNWTNADNWTNGMPAPSFPAVFNSITPNMAVSMNNTDITGVPSILFQSGSGAYTFNADGGSLRLGGITMDSGVTATQTFTLPINIASTSTFTNNSTSASLNLAGGVNNIDTADRLVYFGGDGNISINGLTQTGGGVLRFEKRDGGKLTLNGSSSNTGTTTIRDGIVLINSTTALGQGAIQLSGGILGLGAEDFTRGVGSGNNLFRWVAPTTSTAAGFAAYGADRNVNLGGASASITWNGTSSIRADQQLALGSIDSTHKVTFQNGLNLNNGTRTIVVSDGISSTNVDGEISGVISGAGSSLIKSGAGTLLLSNNNTYDGLTTVSEGTLLINGSIAGGASVASGAVLGGSGIIAGAVTLDGSLRPGNSIGTLTVQNDVTWNEGDAWVFELGSSAASLAEAAVGLSLQDQLSITNGGDFLKGDGTEWTFDFAGTGQEGWYKLVDWTGTSDFTPGDFTMFNSGSGLSGYFAINNNALYLNLNVIPEPGTVGLIALAALALLVSMRRRCFSPSI